MMDASKDVYAPGEASPVSVEYLLKELEIQMAIETKARDRVEQMVNYKELVYAGVDQAALLINIEGEPTGFSYRMSRNLFGLVVICGALGAAALALGISLASSALRDSLAGRSGAWCWLQ